MQVDVVFSAFDGMSCGQVALNRAGVQYGRYYASEINKHPIKVTQSNYRDTIQLGDITKIKRAGLPKVGLLMGGSPCQGFSYSGKMLNFNDGRSKLFFEFVRLLDELKPDYFLLENVKMKKEWEDVITGYLGVEPIKINSSLVSAQSRERVYWTNIVSPSQFIQPEDKNIFIKDITEKGLTNGEVSNLMLHKGIRENSPYRFVPVDSHASKKGLICLGGMTSDKKKLWVDDGKYLQRSFSQGYRVYSDEGKAPTLSANSGGLGGKTGLYRIGGIIRKLTVTECERLQTIPDGYTREASRTQAIEMLGNGWTADVVAHIFKYLK